jgi:O-antigen/teichoic acid export membrane protein
MYKQVLKLLSGNSIGQVIQLVALVFFGFLYGPNDFGRLANIQSIGSIISIVLTLQMHHVIPLAKGKDEAISFFDRILSITSLNFLISSILIFFVNLDIQFAIILSFVLSVNNVLNSFLIYNGQFTTISILYVIRAVSIVFLQLVFFYLGVEGGLLYGALLGESCTTIFLLLKKRNKFKLNFNFKILWKFIIEWKPFSIYGTIQELFSVAIYSLPVIFYTQKFGEAISGQYSISFKLIFAPTVLITSSLSQVLYHQFNNPRGFDFLNKIFWFSKKLIVLSICFLIILILFSYYGEEFINYKWRLSLLILPFMFINACFFIWANPFRVALRFLRLNKVLLLIEMLTLSLMSIFFILKDISVISFTIIIMLISIVQNLLIISIYRYYQKKHAIFFN